MNEFKSNFKTNYQNHDCPMCGKYPDSQEHALLCEVLKAHMQSVHLDIINNVKYGDLYGDIDGQLTITQAFEFIIQARQRFKTSSNSSLPGRYSGPSG